MPEPSSAVSHPQLTRTARAHQREWYERIRTSATVRDQFDKYFGGSTEIFDRLVDAVVGDERVLALGDLECSALHAVIWDCGSSDVSVPGRRTQLVGPFLPAVMAVVGTNLVWTTWLGQGVALDVISREHIRGATPIKASFWVLMTIPGVQYVLDPEDVITCYFNLVGREVAEVQHQLLDPFVGAPPAGAFVAPPSVTASQAEQLEATMSVEGQDPPEAAAWDDTDDEDARDDTVPRATLPSASAVRSDETISRPWAAPPQASPPPPPPPPPPAPPPAPPAPAPPAPTAPPPAAASPPGHVEETVVRSSVAAAGPATGGWGEAGAGVCARCGAPLDLGAWFCGACGTRVVPGAPGIPAADPLVAEPPARRRRGWVLPVTLVTLVALVAAAVVLIVLPRLRASDAAATTPTNEAAPTTDASASDAPTATPLATPDVRPATASEQLELLNQVGARQLAEIPDGTWVPQVSTKCNRMTEMDLQDASGRLGWPDKTPDSFPTGITDEQILSFHLGLASRLDLPESDLMLVTTTDLGVDSGPPPVCEASTAWVSLVTSPRSSTSDGVLRFCADEGMPDGECGARRVGVDTEVVFPPAAASSLPGPTKRHTYPLLVSSYLSVRTEPRVDAEEVGKVPADGYVTIVCTVPGDPVEAVGIVTSRWDRITAPLEGYVSDAWVDTGGRAPPVPAC